MLDLAWEALPKALGLSHEDCCVLQETQIGNVIPDVILGTSIADRLSARNKLTYVEASVLACIENNPFLTDAELLTRIFLAPVTASRALHRLQRCGMVRRADDGKLIGCAEDERDRLEIVAVEFKVRRWRDALRQAIIYRRFSNRAYVVIDASAFDFESDVVTKFLESGVGLLVQSNSELRMVVESKSVVEVSPWRIIAEQKVTNRLAQHRGINFQCVYANSQKRFSKYFGGVCRSAGS